MANRNFNRKQALEKEVKEIYASVAIGASGAPTLDTQNSKGVSTVTRTSAGLYVITLQDSYVRLMQAHGAIVTPTAEDVHVNVSASDVVVAKTVTVRVCTGAIATDPANGDTMLIALQLKNSSVP